RPVQRPPRSAPSRSGGHGGGGRKQESQRMGGRCSGRRRQGILGTWRSDLAIAPLRRYITVNNLRANERVGANWPRSFLLLRAAGPSGAAFKAKDQMMGPNITKRYIRESALEARIAAIVEPVAESLGYDLVRVRVTNENGCTLQIMAENEAGRF